MKSFNKTWPIIGGVILFAITCISTTFAITAGTEVTRMITRIDSDERRINAMDKAIGVAQNDIDNNAVMFSDIKASIGKLETMLADHILGRTK